MQQEALSKPRSREPPMPAAFSLPRKGGVGLLKILRIGLSLRRTRYDQ